MARLENHLPVLATVALVAPLIGFLGTLLGLIDTFVQVSEVTGYATPVQLSRGVYQSLVTSAGGLAIGVPSYIMFAYLSVRARHLMHDMERAGIETLNLVADARATGVIGADAGSPAPSNPGTSPVAGRVPTIDEARHAADPADGPMRATAATEPTSGGKEAT